MSKYTKRLELVAIDKLIPYANNARTHSDEQIKKIQASLREFGFVNLVLIDKDCGIIAGHGRVEAAKREGITKVPCVWVEHLTEAQKRAYILADNRLAEDAGWDDELLKVELNELTGMDFDVSVTGFSNLEMEIYGVGADIKEDNFEVVIPPKPQTKLGQIYQLGQHRLICGDSTDQKAWAQLMDGREALLVITDPPYNMNYEGAGRTPKNKRENNKLKNDKLPKEEFFNMLCGAFTLAYDYLVEGGSFYSFYKELGDGIFFSAINASGLTFKQELIWVKNQIVLGGAKYQNMYEPCIFGCKGKSVKYWNAARKEKSVIESTDYMSEAELIETVQSLINELDVDVLRERKNAVNDLHPTMKPIRLLARFIKNSSSKGDIVVDCFGGSGSTLLACEQLNRACYMMELDPKYCDVIIDRWEQFTGQKAVLVG